MSPVRVLVVDDDAAVRLTLAANLELEGFEVVEAKDGPTALELVLTERLDLVFSDIRMPGMTGVELFLRIRSLRPELPVVLMTAFAVEDPVRTAMSEGVFAVLSKPFEFGHALRTIKAACKRAFVLVVDGPADEATALVEALNAAGVKARSAVDGRSAVQIVTEGEVDVCVVDLLATGQAGKHVVQDIRAINPNVIPIVLTEKLDTDFSAVLGTDAYAYVQKPSPGIDLVEMIAKARSDPRLQRRPTASE